MLSSARGRPRDRRARSDDVTGANITARRDIGRKRPKGYAAWSPIARIRAELEQVDEILVEYRDHLPLTVRQIFYRLVASYGYEKTTHAYDRLGEHLVRARRAKRIPFDYIRDDGIVTYSARWHEDVEDFWNDTGRRIRNYRRDRQAGQRQRVELWCESAGMAPQLASLADRYSVPVFSSGGFSSLPAVRMIVDRAREQNVPTVLLHVGDLDPSGESIFESMTTDAAAFLAEDRRLALQQIIPVRVALTADQVQSYNLPTAAAKCSDSRSGGWRGETCQLEALAPDQLAAIIVDEISALFDPEVLQRQLEQEKADAGELWRGLPRGDS